MRPAIYELKGEANLSEVLDGAGLHTGVSREGCIYSAETFQFPELFYCGK